MQEITSVILKKKVINLVSNDKTKKALELLKHVTLKNPNDFSDAIFIQLSEFELLQLSSLKGILSYEEKGLRRRNIKAKILEISGILSSTQRKFIITDSIHNKFFGKVVSKRAMDKKNGGEVSFSTFKNIKKRWLFFLVSIFLVIIYSFTKDSLIKNQNVNESGFRYDYIVELVTLSPGKYDDSDKVKFQNKLAGYKVETLFDEYSQEYRLFVQTSSNIEDVLLHEKEISNILDGRSVLPKKVKSNYSNVRFDHINEMFIVDAHEKVKKRNPK